MRLRVLLAVILCASAAYGQMCNVSEIERYPSWTVPGLQGSHPKKKIKYEKSSSATGISERELAPGSQFAKVEYFTCSKTDPRRIKIIDMKVRILSLKRLEAYGKTFGYAVATQWYTSDGIPAAGLSTFIYIDEGGEGRFSVLRETLSVSDLSLPKWVQPSSQNRH